MSSVSRVQTALGVICVFTSVTTAACSGSPSAGKPPAPSSVSPTTRANYANWPAAADDFRFRWSAAPGLDLTTQPLVALRGFMESRQLLLLTNSPLSDVYPGYLRATESAPSYQKASTPFRLRDLRPWNGGQSGEINRVYGYQAIHVLSVTPEPDGFRTMLCLGGYATYHKAASGRNYTSIQTDKDGRLAYPDLGTTSIWRAELTNRQPAADAPAMPLAPQRGPLPAPTLDIFGNWTITGANGGGVWDTPTGSEVFNTVENRRLCQNSMPDSPERQTALATGFHDAPPPHGDPVPGWPTEAR